MRTDKTSRRAFWLTVVLATGLLVAITALAQGPQVLLDARFDERLDANSAADKGAAEAERVERRPVAVRGSHAVEVQAGGHLCYTGPGNANLERGSLDFAVQPQAPLGDGRNHLFVAIGATDAPNSVRVWKTATQNDLRFRFVLPDGKNADAVSPAPSLWLPGSWHHVLCTWDWPQGQTRLYVDGRAAGAYRSEAQAMTAEPGTISIGATADGKDRAAAVIDDVRFWDQALPGGRVSREYEHFLSAERIAALNPWEGPPRPLSLALVPQPDFMFAVISDPHVSKPGQVGRYSHNWRVEELVKQLNALQPDFVLNAGDTITTFPGRPDFDACAERGLELFSALKPPIYHTAGNHDIGNKLQLTYRGNPKDPNNERYVKGYFVNDDNIADYRRYFGDDYFSFDHQGCHFVVTDNALLNSGLAEEKKQWEWLLKDLESARDAKQIFMSMHNPLFWYATDDPGTGNYENVNEPARGEFIALTRKYGVRAVFTGHTHHRITNTLGGTLFCTLPSTTFARNFGNSYGLPGLAVVWDPQRVGYYVARVYGREAQINLVRSYPPLPPRAPLQEGQPAPETRALGRKAQEIGDDGFAMKSVPPPGRQRGIWHIDGMIDGVKPEGLKGRGIDQHCWTSDAHAEEDQTEWVQVELGGPVALARVELHARPGGRPFPTDFVLRVSADGESWQTVAEKTGFEPPADGSAIPFPVTGRPEVRFVRLDMTKLPVAPDGNLRASIVELCALDTEGRDRALLQAGAKATCKTQAGGGRITIDDHGWTEPAEAGMKWAILPRDGLSWEEVEHSRGSYDLPVEAQRAFGLGYLEGVNYVVPLTTSHALYADAGRDAFRGAFLNYARALREALGEKVAGWRLIPGGAAADDLPLLAEIAKMLKGVVGGRLLVSGLAVGVDGRLSGVIDAGVWSAADGIMVRVDGEPSPEKLFSDIVPAVTGIVPKEKLWLELAPWPSSRYDDLQRSKLVARAMVLARASGVRLAHWAAPGETGAVLTPSYTPTPLLYACRAGATLWSGATPATDLVERVDTSGRVRQEAFRGGDGATLLALWQETDVGKTARPVRCRVVLKGAAAEALGIDTIGCTLQDLKVEDGAIDGLLVRDYPLVVRVDG